jgi:osmoprotectant transport system ATP-binding protein
MVTHDLQEAFQLGDRILIMDQGKIQQVGKKMDLVNQPANDFVKNFLKNQYLFLQLEIRKLGDFFSFFEKTMTEGVLIGELKAEESLEKAFELFSSDQARENLSVINNQGDRRFTSSVQLLRLLAGDLK